MVGWSVLAAVVLSACGHLDFDPTALAPADGSGSGSGPACLASYELCDGFEGSSFAPVWTVDGDVTLDTTVAHRGLSSAHVHGTAIPVHTDSYILLYEDTTLPEPATTFYVRAWVRLAEMPVNNMDLIVAEQSNGSPEGDSLTVRPTDLAIYSQFADVAHDNMAMPPLDTWFCVLWTVARSTTSTGSIALAGDPPPLMIQAVQTDASPAIDRMTFGISFAAPNIDNAQPAIDLWFDDLIIASFPIACTD